MDIILRAQCYAGAVQAAAGLPQQLPLQKCREALLPHGEAAAPTLGLSNVEDSPQEHWEVSFAAVCWWGLSGQGEGTELHRGKAGRREDQA